MSSLEERIQRLEDESAIRELVAHFAFAATNADHEGFSNEEGFHILWQFSNSVKGTWWMGVLKDGRRLVGHFFWQNRFDRFQLKAREFADRIAAPTVSIT